MVDYFQVFENLSDEEKIAWETARKFVDEEVLPIINEYFENYKFPLHLVKKMGELGFLGINLPSEYGCPGLNNMAYGLVMMELERGDSGIRSFASVQSSLVMYPIFQFGSEEQKKKYLPELARGKLIGCFGLTEPDFGSDAGGIKTTAVKDGNSYVLNGTKMWITNGSIADIAVVWAKLNGEIRGFIVEKGTPGFTTVEIKRKMSLRASVTSELHFEDCRIPAENILPGTAGLKSALMCLNQARYSIAWGAIGSAIASYEAALNYARERIQFGKPIASFQLVQKKLVWMLTEITKAQLMMYQLARLKDSGKVKHTQISMAKMNNVNMALEIARVARDIHGANGITLDYPPIRHLLNMEAVNTYEGTYDIQTLIIGRDITGFQAFR